jgi:hypothetical protein
MINKNAQLFLVDILFAIFVFISMFILINKFTIEFFTKSEEIDNEELLESVSITAIDLLLRNEGIPPHWTKISEVKSIGLIITPYVINLTKFQLFIAGDYAKIKRLLNLVDYEFYFEVLDLEGDLLGKKGLKQEEKHKIWITKPIIYKNKLAKVNFIVSRK